MKSSSRNGARVRLLAVHTTEGIKRARDLIAFFNRADAQGSSHAGADSTGTLLGPESGYVPYDRAAWTLRSGNPVSDNLEYCGFARYTRQEWLTLEASGLEGIARWLAERHIVRGIPLVKLSPADVKAGKSGVIGHNDWTVGMKDGSHWDPGPGFPWDVVIDRAKQIVAELAAMAAGAPAPAPALKKEPDMSFIRLGPGESATIPRPRGGQVFVDMAMDNNGVPIDKADVDGMRVRAALRRGGNDSQTWLPFAGSTFDFWAPNAKIHSRELAPEDSLLVVANQSAKIALGVTITHVL